MTKISEAIKHYESIKPQTKFDSYFGDPFVSTKIYTLKLIQEAIGDVDFTDDYLKAYVYGMSSFPFQTSYERKIQKIRLIYELSKDTKMTIDELLTLMKFYHAGTYILLFRKIKELIISHKDIEIGLEIISKEACEYGVQESKKLDYLLIDYSEDFIKQIKQVVTKECISSDRVLEILPSKSFIDASAIVVPGLGYKILSGEDLIVRRLKFIKVEKDFQKTSLGEKIALGYSSTGDIVYTSFTKGEYEENLKKCKKLIRKK